MTPKRIEILGVPVDSVTMDQALDWAESMIKGQHPCTILAVNPEKVMRARQDSKLLDQLRAADLLIPDGIGIVLAARLLGLGRMERMPGSELMPALCELAANKGYRVFLFGAKPVVNERAAVMLQKRHPQLTIAGKQDGYVKPEDMPALVKKINDSGAQILFVALGSPAQEMWMDKYLPELSVKVCQGVGGTFDVIAGTVKRAPLVYRKLYLEWFFRLLKQPSRISRQVLYIPFLTKVLLGRIFDGRAR